VTESPVCQRVAYPEFFNRLIRMKTAKASNATASPGLGLGVGAVALNSCPSTDMSLFCQFSRFFQVVTMVVTLAIIVWVVYSLVIPYLTKKGRGGRR
jgi:hypothetical protein